MTKDLLLRTAFVSCLSFNVYAQDTFSIVGLDTLTGEVGSAGASCVDLFQTSFTDPSFLGQLVPGVGAINTQASYHSTNQNNARTRMNLGDTPAQIIAWLTANDVGANPHIRQYGIVGTISGSVMTAAWTGTNCINYKNHIIGRNYAIQGNILLGQVVLDSKESKFKRTPGTLACKLMAALQGAKMVGADTRCSTNNSSSLFAFVKVSKPNDVYGSPYITLSVKTHTNDSIEPIDSLQTNANNINLCGIYVGTKENSYQNALGVYPNPAKTIITVLNASPYRIEKVIITDLYGKEVKTVFDPHDKIDVGELARGIYLIEVRSGEGTIYRSKIMKE